MAALVRSAVTATGFAMPKKIVTPWPPQWVDNTSSGTPKQLLMSSQLFITQTSPAGLVQVWR